jgi:hypothetical protein
MFRSRASGCRRVAVWWLVAGLLSVVIGCHAGEAKPGSSAQQLKEKRFYGEVIPILQQQLEHSRARLEAGRAGSHIVDFDQLRLLVAQERSGAITQEEFEKGAASLVAKLTAWIESQEGVGRLGPSEATEARIWLAWVKNGLGLLPGVPKGQQ